MQNNDVRMATQSQIAMLQKLGYTGDTTRLTLGEASNLIGQLQRNSTMQQPQAPVYNQPVKQPTYQTTYQAPVQQQQTYAPQVANQDVTIKTRDGETIQLDKQTVEMYICGTDKNGNVIRLTDAEYKYFFSVCKAFGLNPFLKDIYAIKFGTQPATFVIDYKVLQQSADEQSDYNGMKTGVLISNQNGVVSEREGAYILPNETLIGAWCEVYRKSRTFPIKSYAMFSEVCQRTKEGELNSNWKNKPVFMNVKVAKAWALREAFPNMFSNNTYTSDEIVVEDKTPSNARSAYTEVINHQQESMATVVVDDETGEIEEDNLFNQEI